MPIPESDPHKKLWQHTLALIVLWLLGLLANIEGLLGLVERIPLVAKLMLTA